MKDNQSLWQTSHTFWSSHINLNLGVGSRKPFPAAPVPGLEEFLLHPGLAAAGCSEFRKPFQLSNVYPSLAAKALGKPGPVALISNQTGH